MYHRSVIPIGSKVGKELSSIQLDLRKDQKSKQWFPTSISEMVFTLCSNPYYEFRSKQTTGLYLDFGKNEFQAEKSRKKMV